MERAGRSLGHKLTLAILVTAGSLLCVGGGAVVVAGFGPVLLMIVLGVCTIFLTGAAWFASTRLVSVPLLRLADDVRALSAARDYSGRVATQTSTEVGSLVDCFNELLAELQQREQLLRERDQHLATVEERQEAERDTSTRELREVNERLEAATARATAADQSRSQFVANITHELRTPMNGVFGMAELLLNTGLTPQQEKYTRAVMNSAEDLLGIVNNILDFSKVDAGKFEKIDNQPFSPKKCVDQVLDLLVGRAQQVGLALSHECDDDVPAAMLGDGKRLRQVLTNLVGNAIKFTKEGKIVVRTSLLEHGENGSTVRFEVVDTGIGIPEYLHKDIFEGFSQVDRSTTRQFGGTGLGLAISKHLVTLMGGEIDLVSRPGVGSNFWFTVQGELYVPEAADLDLGGARALIIAAVGENGETLQNQLVSCGGDGVVVASAEEAVAAILAVAEGQPTFDLALIDTQDLDVRACVSRLRAEARARTPPLVLVSTVARGASAVAKEGLDDSITKPVRQEDLFACIVRVTGRTAVPMPPGTDHAAAPEQAATAGARILVAEDNRVNREVVTTMLESLGCQVEVVFDGAEAVEAVQRKTFDLIFLDCEMPNLDGYQTAVQIRKLEDQDQLPSETTVQRSGHLPIVALTAHTSPSDRARGLENGMDDYVSKPLSLQKLRGVVARWVGGQPASTEPQSTEPDPPSTTPDLTSNTPDDAPISDAALEPILELDRLNGGNVFARVVKIFLQETPETLQDLRSAAHAGDAEGIARAAHALKSSSHNVGAESLATLCQELEAQARRGSSEGAETMATRADALYLTVKTALEARLERDHRDTVVSV